MPTNSTFEALAHPTRREILAMLREGDLTAGQIASRFQVSAPSISHHLARLKEAGLVTCEREGQRLIYGFNATVFQECVEALMNVMSRGDGRDDP